MEKLKNLGQALTKQQQQEVMGGIWKNCNTCIFGQTICDPELPMCPNSNTSCCNGGIGGI